MSEGSGGQGPESEKVNPRLMNQDVEPTFRHRVEDKLADVDLNKLTRRGALGLAAASLVSAAASRFSNGEGQSLPQSTPTPQAKEPVPTYPDVARGADGQLQTNAAEYINPGEFSFEAQTSVITGRDDKGNPISSPSIEGDIINIRKQAADVNAVDIQVNPAELNKRGISLRRVLSPHDNQWFQDGSQRIMNDDGTVKGYVWFELVKTDENGNEYPVDVNGNRTDVPEYVSPTGVSIHKKTT